MMYNKTLDFYKDQAGWFCDVRNHSRSQNAMVLGADKLLDFVANGNNKVSISLSFANKIEKDEKPAKDSFLVKLRRILHDPFGATYWVSGPASKGFPLPTIWICNVTHDALPELDHPKQIFINKITSEQAQIPIECYAIAN